MRILVVDDDLNMARACLRLFQRMGYEADSASSAAEAIEKLQTQDYALLLTDLVMPEIDGIGLLREARRLRPELPVVLMTGYATIKTAVSAMREGATDYVTKPFEPSELEATVKRIFDQRNLEGEVRRLQKELDLSDPAPELVGRSDAMHTIKDLIRAAGRTLSPVLIHGPSGTGKELVARAIHKLSAKAKGPFVPVNCGALPEGLAESELFGNVKGAYTGAGVARDGLFRSADRGTIFLDEIGEMPMDLQVKLLRALQERAIRPVGGTRELPLDVRVLAATNKEPSVSIREGGLREDLYYRLAVFVIEVPPLSARTGDVPVLADHLLRRLKDRYGSGPGTLHPAAQRALESYPWPGNVRELENVLDRAFVLRADAAEIRLEDLPASVRGQGFPAPATAPKDGPAAPPHASPGSATPAPPARVEHGPGSAPPAHPAEAAAPSAPVDSPQSDQVGPDTLARTEASIIRRALAQADGNKAKAARALGISRPLLYKRMKEHGIDI